MAEQKTISFGPRSRARVLHIETDGCIVNIRRGLTNTNGQSVTSIQVVCDQYRGEPKWSIPDAMGPEEAARIISRDYGLFDTMTMGQIETHLRNQLKECPTLNLRVVQEEREV